MCFPYTFIVMPVRNVAGVDFDSVNVLDYPLIREGVKKYR